MAFFNRIRLPFYLTHAQFPDERNVFRLADGTSKIDSVVIRKVYEGKTNYMPEIWHQRLKIALCHDIVNIEGERYFGEVVIEGDYDIGWVDFLDYPIAQAEFKVQVSPFNATNSNCQTCDEATQLMLVDDTFPDSLFENADYTISTFDNDSISCFPFTSFLVWFNPAVFTTALIDDNGIIECHTKTPLASANNIKLLTYRVTCPNGGFDEADVYGTIEGSIVACLEPTNIHPDVAITDNQIDLSWDNPTPVPVSYYWELYKADNLGLAVETRTVLSADPHAVITGLEPCTDYSFFIRSVCDGANSEFVQYDFSTECLESCGKYEVEYNDGTGMRTGFSNVTYIACDSSVKTVRINNMTSRILCVLHNAPGDPVEIIGATLITYIEPCP